MVASKSPVAPDRALPGAPGRHRHTWSWLRITSFYVLLLIVLTVVWLFVLRHFASAVVTTSGAHPQVPAAGANLRRVTCLGRLEPFGQVVTVGPSASQRYESIGRLLVHEGDHLRFGQPIAVMQSEPKMYAALVQAGRKVQVANARLAQVKAGAKQGEITAQTARVIRSQEDLDGQMAEQRLAIDRLRGEQRFADREYQRHRNLFQQGAVSLSVAESKRTAWQTASARVQEAMEGLRRLQETLSARVSEEVADLNRVSEVRQVDVQLADAELSEAKAAEARARTEYDQAFVRAPKDGTVLKVLARAGEVPGDRGMIELGDTSTIVAVAEVYENELGYISMEQAATVRGASFPGKLKGKVYQVGLKVIKQSVFSNEPGANFDNRVVEVRVRLDQASSALVAGLTNAQVQVEFQKRN